MSNSSFSSILPSNKAIAYVRVSTKEQEEKGSIPYQKDLALKYVAKYNEDILSGTGDEKGEDSKKIYLDESMILEEALPASTVVMRKAEKDLTDSFKTRPKLQEIIERAQRKEFGHLIVQSRDRLARDFEQFIYLKYIFKRCNVKIHYCRPAENIDFEDEKINRFVDNILASVAELEANIIAVRVKSGSKQCIENGNWAGGRPPLGYIIERLDVPGKKRPVAKLKTSFYERNQIIQVFNLYAQGFSYNEIAKKINTDNGYDVWTKSKVESIIKNQTYTGYITWDRRGGRRHSGKHEGPPLQSKFNKNICFINKEQWDFLANLRTYKKSINDPKYFNTPYLLKNKLVCGICNQKLRTKNYGRNNNGENICVYRCSKKLSDNKSELILNKTYIEDLVIEKVKEELNNMDIDTLWPRYIAERDKMKEASQNLLNEIQSKIKYINLFRDNIQQMIQDLEDKPSKENNENDENKISYTNFIIDRLVYQDTLLLKTKQRYEYDKAIEERKAKSMYIDTKSDYEKLLKRFVVNIDKLDNRNKRMLIDLIIDKIIVDRKDNETSISIIFNPSELVR